MILRSITNSSSRGGEWHYGGLGTEGIVGGSGGNLTSGGSGKLGGTVKPRILHVGGRRWRAATENNSVIMNIAKISKREDAIV
jgi:hypothetical protein